MTTLFVEDLTVMDFSFLHHGRGLLGESWIVSVELSGQLDDEGVIFDFAYAKKAIKTLIDSEFDHKLVIPNQSEFLSTEEVNKNTVILFQTSSKGIIHYDAPTTSYCFLPSEIVSMEATKHYLETLLKDVLPNNINKINLSFKTEFIDGVFYHYSHGLKKHYGNCQRMAHGHRSTLKIYKDGIRDESSEHFWAKKWEDIYIGTKEDLIAEEIDNNTTYYIFKYSSGDGTYQLKIAKDSCDIIETETTVEFLAHHMAKILKNENPKSTFRVTAFEGVKKGAVAEY